MAGVLAATPGAVTSRVITLRHVSSRGVLSRTFSNSTASSATGTSSGRQQLLVIGAQGSENGRAPKSQVQPQHDSPIDYGHFQFI